MSLLVGTLVDWPLALPAPRPPLMKRMCAGRPGRECGLVLGWVVCVRENAGHITHTACDACHGLFLAELADMQANERGAS
jgi:hypothetical protein